MHHADESRHHELDIYCEIFCKKIARNDSIHDLGRASSLAATFTRPKRELSAAARKSNPKLQHPTPFEAFFSCHGEFYAKEVC